MLKILNALLNSNKVEIAGAVLGDTCGSKSISVMLDFYRVRFAAVPVRESGLAARNGGVERLQFARPVMSAMRT